MNDRVVRSYIALIVITAAVGASVYDMITPGNQPVPELLYTLAGGIATYYFIKNGRNGNGNSEGG